jgi:hypothetical protein
VEAPKATGSRSAAGILAAGAVVLALAAPAAHAAPPASVEQQAFSALRERPVFIHDKVSRLVDEVHLTYAALTASRAADGAQIKLAFVSVPNSRLDSLRDRLYVRLRLGPGGALVLANPLAITMRTATLTIEQEAAIIQLDGRALRRMPGNYTKMLAELTYDTGLVIHNSTPGVAPRGDGADRNLETFSGRFPGEAPRPGDPRAARAASGGFRVAWALYAVAGAVALALAVRIGLLRRRLRG